MVRVRPLGCDFTLDAPERNREWYESRGYELMSTNLFRTVVRGATAVLDIGAHVGYYSLLARSADPSAAIVAIEASPDNVEVLRSNVAAASSDVTVVHAAFGAVSGTATFYLTEASDNSGLTGHPNSPTVRTAEVAAVTGADLELPAGGRLVVKLDVEGHEIAALDGLASLLGSYDDVRLLVEFNPKCLSAAGSSADGLIARLQSDGYRLFVLDEVALSWRELAAGRAWEDLVDVRGYANLYCVPADRATTLSVVMHSGGIGGAERSHTEMTHTLIRAGGMVHTVVPEPDLGLRGELEALGGSVTAVEPFRWWMTWPHDALPVHDPQSWTKHLVHRPLIEAIEQVQPDVVLTQSGVIPQGAVAAAATGRPHVWYLREFGDLDHGLVVPGGARGAGALIRELSDAVITNSAAVRDHFFGTDAQKVSVIHPVPSVQVAEEPVERADRPWTLGIVASLNPGKGQEDALGAIALLRHDGTDVPLVLVGPAADADHERILKVAARLGVGDLVTITGSSHGRGELYAQFDAVAVTSRSEAFGRIPFEATAVGLPVIYSDAGGPHEYMEPGVTGLAYAPGDVESLALAIRTVRDEPGLGAKLVTAARGALFAVDREATFEHSLEDVLRAARAGGGQGGQPVLREVVGWLAATVGAEDQELETVRRDLRQVIAAHEELVPRFRQLESDHDALVRGHLGVVEAFERLRSEYDEGQAAYHRSRENNRVLRGVIGDLQDAATVGDRARRELSERLAAAQESAEELRQAHELVVNSRVWRTRSRLAQIFGAGRRR